MTSFINAFYNVNYTTHMLRLSSENRHEKILTKPEICALRIPYRSDYISFRKVSVENLYNGLQGHYVFGDAVSGSN